MTPAAFCDLTQLRLVIMYRRFGTSNRYHLQGFNDLGTTWRLKMEQIGSSKTSYGITNLCCVRSQKSARVPCTATEALNHTNFKRLRNLVDNFTKKNINFCKTWIFFSCSCFLYKERYMAYTLGHLCPVLEIQHLFYPIPLYRAIQTTLYAKYHWIRICK